MNLSKAQWENLKNGIWILTPSVVFSLAFKSFILIIDPFFFPLAERYIKKPFAVAGKIIWLALFAITILYAWNISPPSYYFFLTEALFYSPTTILVEVFAFVLTLGLLVFYMPIDSGSRRFPWIILAAGVTLATLKAAAVHYGAKEEFTGISVRSITSANLRIVRNAISAKKDFDTTDIKVTQSYFNQKKTEPRAAVNEVLMLVESWGEKNTTLERIANEINQTELKVAQYGFVPYSGSTLNAEFRELCSTNVTLTENVSSSRANIACAPGYLKDRGYRVLGFHGYGGQFYARNIIWRRFGIETRNFLEEINGGENCAGVFNGVCDASLIRAGLDSFDDKHPTFVYFLTLSSHEPVWQNIITHDSTYFKTIPAESDAQIMARNAISSMVTQVLNRKYHACTSIYIVGDHQPPSLVERGVFERNRVPFIRLQANCSSNAESDRKISQQSLN